MATYILLCNFTDQGIRNIKDTTKRADAVREADKKFGANMKEIFWTQGQYDMVVTVEAPDDASVSARPSRGRCGKHSRADPAGVFEERDERDPREGFLSASHLTSSS